MAKKKDKLCVQCKERRAVSCRKQYNFSRNQNHYAYRSDHDLCDKCWQAIRDRMRTA